MKRSEDLRARRVVDAALGGAFFPLDPEAFVMDTFADRRHPHERVSDSKPRRPIDDLLAAQDWGAVHAELMEYAYRLTRSWDLAEDLSQGAICRVLDSNYKGWDPEKEPKLVRHLGSLVNTLLGNLRDTKSLSRQTSYAPEAKVWKTRVDSAQLPDHQIAERQTASRALEALRVRVAGDALVAAVVELYLEAGTDKPAELALATGRPIEEIYNAQRRLAAHMAAVRRELEGDAP